MIEKGGNSKLCSECLLLWRTKKLDDSRAHFSAVNAVEVRRAMAFCET